VIGAGTLNIPSNQESCRVKNNRNVSQRRAAIWYEFTGKDNERLSAMQASCKNEKAA
jgi:hypothetical protein